MRVGKGNALQDLSVLQGLDNCEVVVFVDIAVDGSRHVFVLVGLTVLVGHGFSDILMHRCLVLAIARGEVRNSLLCLLHDEMLEFRLWLEVLFSSVVQGMSWC